MAAGVGLERQLRALTDKRPDRHGFVPKEEAGWCLHIEGACGEAAVAKALNRFWDGSVDSFKSGGDVGGIQVRTRSRHDYELIVRADDRDTDVFVLVTGRAPTFRVVGYILGRDAKRPEFLQRHGNRPGAYFVPYSVLTPFVKRERTRAA